MTGIFAKILERLISFGEEYKDVIKIISTGIFYNVINQF